MALDGAHWIIGFLAALTVHVMGLLWLDSGQKTVPLGPEQSVDEIVVMLGSGSGHGSEIVPVLSDTQEVARVDAADTVTPPPQDLTAQLDRQPEVTTPTGPPVDDSRFDREPDPASTAEPPEEVELSHVAEPLAPVNTPEVVRSESSTTIESVTARASVTLALPDTSLESEQPRPLVGEVGPAPEIIEIVAPETIVVKQSVPDVQVAPTEIETPPAVDQVVELSATDPEVADLQPAEVAGVVTSEIDQSVDVGGQVASVVLDLDSVETIDEVDQVSVATDLLSPKTEPIVTLEEQVARAMSLDELPLGGAGIVARYAGLLKGWLQENMHYPRAAQLAGQQGRVVIRFVIDRNGNVLSIELEQASGFPILDREAIEMIQRADPFPVIPREMSGPKLELRVPVAFQIMENSKIKRIPPINLE